MPLKDQEARRKYHREYMQRHLSGNPEARQKQRERVKANNARYKEEKVAWLQTYLLDHPCVDCGEPDIIVLEFDHVTGQKLGNVADLARGGFSLAKLKDEVRKCKVRCANCHRRITHHRRTPPLIREGT